MANNKDIKKLIALFLEDHLANLEEQISEIIQKIIEAKLKILMKMIEERAIQGEPGEPGKLGPKPVVGKDFKIPVVDTKKMTKEITAVVVGKIPPAIPGKDADEVAIFDRLVKRIPKQEPFKLNIDDIIAKMSIKKGLFDISFIAGLKEELQQLAETIRTARRLGDGGGGGGQGSWKVNTLVGNLDGSNTTFTYSGALPALNSEHVMLNSQEQNPLDEYTIAAVGGTVTVTYTTAPDSAFSGLPHYIRYT